MEELDYEKKFGEMQKYIPFLDRVIAKLKNSDQDKPRKAQLEKMQTLHNLLHNKDKKIKIDTLLKCETVLKKLHAKIEKSDDSPKNSMNTSIASNIAKKVHIASPPAIHASTKYKFVPNSNLIEIHTCPASPPHLGEEDFRPPLEIPTERRSSPVKSVISPHWEKPNISKNATEAKLTRTPMINSVARLPNRSINDVYHTNNTNSHHKFIDAPKNSRWSDARDRTRDESPSSSLSSYQRSSWSSTSTSLSSNIHRSQAQRKNEAKYSSEEENWDEPEEEPLPKTKPDPKPIPSTLTSSSYDTHNDSISTHHHRYYENNKSYKSQIGHTSTSQPPLPVYPPLPDTDPGDDFQNKLYHDTIYKYKKSEAPFNNFMNPSNPEPRMQKQLMGNIFNRLGDKVDGYENFRIQVINDKIKSKLPHNLMPPALPPLPPPCQPPPPPPPLLVTNKPIGEVLKSPPLSADDIDDLLNESLDAAMDNQIKPNSSENTLKEQQKHSLDAVRKKLALISRPLSPPRLESSTIVENKADEPFYRRGHTPSKKPIDVVQQNKSELKTASEDFITPSIAPRKSFSLESPKSPTNPMDAVVERLALKYKPHKRRESVSVERNYPLQGEQINTPHLPMKDTLDSMGHRSKQSSHRESIVSPGHTVDPRVAKSIMGNIPPLMSLPVSPVPNVLPTINHFDPRLRNTLPLNKDIIPFTVPKPYSPIPSLLDLHINIPTHNNSTPSPSLPSYNNSNPSRVDPRTQKCSKTYADKFNPERNDKTERMKYLESKRNKPPEPKTYGEYRQSKSRQQMSDGDGKAPHTTESMPTPAASSIQPAVPSAPSALDKLYRTADYGKEITSSIQGFKIPKKSKPEVPKLPEPKKDNHEPKSGEESKNESTSNVEQIVKKNLQKPEEDLPKKSDDDKFESAKKLEEPQKANELPKEKEKLSKNGKTMQRAPQDVETKKQVIPETKNQVIPETKKQLIPETKKKKTATKSHGPENAQEVEILENKILNKSPVGVETKKQTQEKDSQTPKKANKTLVSESDQLKCNSKTSDSFNDSITESVLVIDESESPNKSTDESTFVIDESDYLPEPKVLRPRRSLNKKNLIKDRTPSPELKTKETPSNDDANDTKVAESEKDENKPHRISTRRSTIIKKEPPEEIETRNSESPTEITRTRCRSASDIFSPTTDNSVVSTQNIISGKRRTRASINFNEKTIKKTPTPKTVTPVASPPAITQTPKTRAPKVTETKKVVKKRNSVTSEQLNDNIEKKNSEDGQICAVSSTTEGPHHEPVIVAETPVLPEEPSSSNAPDQTQPKVVDADNQKKQEFLEGFLMSIVDPTANKDRIIDMLKTVLDDKKLQQVKEILYSPQKDVSNNVSDKKGDEEEEEHPEQSKPRVTKPKKNELDRLNEDIRDMFICQGVVTATGRRMCTLAKNATANNTPVQPQKKKTVQPKTVKSPVINVQPEPLVSKRPMRKAKVLISPLNIRALRSRNQKTNRSPKMPVLEPNTPIKISDSESKNRKSNEELTKTRIIKNKSEINTLKNNLKKRLGPKSKRPQSDSSDSSDDDIELVHLRNKIKRMDEMKIEMETNKKLNVGKNEKANVKKIVEKETEEQKETKTKNDDDEKEMETIKKPCETTTAKSVEKPKDNLDIPPKNINPEFHTKSDYSNCCVICKEKARYIAPHYLNVHNDSEVYTSRLPAAVLEDIKLNIGNRAFYAIYKKPHTLFNYSCPFCDFTSTQSMRGWMEHFTIHTGEYGHKCSKCFKAMNGCTHMMDHIRKYCPDAKKINRDPINLRGQAIIGYVCHLCNFIQMLRGGVIRHLKVHHDLEDAESIGAIIEVKLIDSVGVPKKEENKANVSVTELATSSANKSSVLAPIDVSESKPNELSKIDDSKKEESLKLSEKDDDVVISKTDDSKKEESLKLSEKDDDVVISKIDDSKKEESLKLSEKDDDVVISKIDDSKKEESLKLSEKDDDVVISKIDDSKKEESLKLSEKDDVVIKDSTVNMIPASEDKPAEKNVTEDVSEKLSIHQSSMSFVLNEEEFLPSDLLSSAPMVLTDPLKSIEKDDVIAADSAKVLNEQSKSVAMVEIIDLDSDVEDADSTVGQSKKEVVADNSREKSNNQVNNTNMEVFLPRDLASPTSLVFTERLKSIEKDDAIAADSDANKTKSAEKKITIAEKLSQRFKNIEKQNIADEDARADKNNCPTEKESHVVPLSIPAMAVPKKSTVIDITIHVPLPSNLPEVPMQSLNDSDNLIIDEQAQNKSPIRDDDNDYLTESDDGNQNEEDDNDNWEDIEITETTNAASHKDRNKNKSIFQTLSRLYASIAPKKSSKKNKDKEKEKEKKKVGEISERLEKTTEKTTCTTKSNSIKPVSDEILDPLLLPTSSKPTTTTTKHIPNLSEFIPDSPGDSLDMLLTANFNCLDGDGNSFPQLDLNDLESSIFPLPEEQESIHDAIALATDMDHIRYDVLGNPLSLGLKPQQNASIQSSTSIQTIGNFGFSLNGNSFKYYCMVKSCTFLFSDHPDGLQNHFLLEHPSLKWNGYCDTCKMQVGYGDCGEMKHILDVHSRLRNEDSGDKPRIKFRRLTGDILSTEKQMIENMSNEVQSTTPAHVTPSHVAQSHTPPPQAGPLHIEPSHKVQSKPSRTATSHTAPPHTTPSHTAPSHTAPSLTTTSLIAPSRNAPNLAALSSRTPELSLSTMLQSEPKAMIPPKAPPKSDMDIPLFKNVSKEFTITNVAEGVTDNDLLNLVLKQADSAPGGIQISQVISLNAGGKSVSPTPLTHISNRITSSERRNSTSLKEISSSIRDTEKQSPRASPKPAQMNSLLSHRKITPKNPITKQSAFICCVTNCSFSTNIRSTMNEHILSHIRCDNNRESLRCHVCRFIGQDTNHYFNHMTQKHSKYDVVATSCSSTVELTQKIQDILRTTTSKNKHPSEKQQTTKAPTPPSVPVPSSRSLLLPVPAPVSVSTQEKNLRDTDSSFAKKLRKIAEEIVESTGVPEEEIWRCIFYPECEYAITEKDFQTHLATHTNIVPTSFPSLPPGSSLNCPHCPVNYYRPAVLKAHLKTHARHQFFCNICSCTTFGSFPQVQKHFNDIHSLAGGPRIRNMIPEDKSNKPPFLIASETELTTSDLIQFAEKITLDWERRKAVNKTHFKPNEQNLLPIQPIFNNQVYCSVCNYKTKVRTNMFRHLQLHNQDVDVGSVDPVNPVPCLEKNEKHFDKMLNLACSSNSTMKSKESVKIPVFVPDMRRYVCGHPGCKYLTITDQMLRSHLNALHGNEKGYQCPHCQEEISKKNMCAERVVQHLKFHGNKIYQCSECEYFHYTKHVVERHVNEKHAGVLFVNLITYDRNDNETKKSTHLVSGRNVTSSHSASSECDSAAESTASSSTPTNNKMKWECALCKHQTATWNQMISHANSMHNAKHQYHCVHCTFGAAHLAHIMDHIDTKHPTKIREAKYVFYKINETPQDKAADTRPLWSRNDPKRVRSIRGILMENEEDAERTKKNLRHAGIDLDDEDEEVLAPVSDSDSSVIPDGLACFHCNFTSKEMSSLSQHWKTKHWHEKNSEMVPRIPFFFRIHTALKCPLCTHVGDQITLKIHLINVHGHRNFCASDPNLPNTCGHCPFVYSPQRLDILINHYLCEHKATDAKNLTSGLLKNLLALGECQVYMQCYFCAEICADKNSIIEHERERHKNSNFRYKQIKDEVIYRCAMCQYSSTNELATLRHMIDHFEGFNVCHFCKSVQSSFNSYMQHCYTFHMKALTNFKEIYDIDKITSFLLQMLLIFPNGLIAAKSNLLDTQYGNTERINAMYDEICKKALEPPIPPLCMGRLLAKKSVEASTLLPPPPATVTARRIAKRRSTVAMGGCERGSLSSFIVPSEPQKIKKRKSSICGDFLQLSAPLFSTITAKSNNIIENSAESCDIVKSKCNEPEGFSFYGKKPEPIDLSKIYTHIAIGDKYAPVSVKRFSLLFKINTKVVVEEVTNHRKYQSNKRHAPYSKPCPASKKKKFS